MSWRHQMSTHKTLNILLNNLERKHSLVMKFSQLMQYYKGKIFNKNSIKNVPGLF